MVMVSLILINALLRTAPHGVKHATRDLEQAAPRDASRLQTYHWHFHTLIAATVLVIAVEKYLAK